ncbi:peroxisomal coenzyme A diphosphatase NUDT7-like isoform X1 [Mytilus edulis]|uniref:peroxisomal coenzyme A diphosphatase NUDT7-like isoform X1 n=1 Tax=Mytilus edulis TaxID=6550 RepID=UPI0039F0F790
METKHKTGVYISLEDVRKRFSTYDIRLKDKTSTPPVFDKASVLVPLFQLDREWHVLLTVRSKHLRSHSGLVAFPGGKQDSDDLDDIETALREAEEEIGLNPNEVEVISVLPGSFVRPNVMVTVVVGIIPYNFKPVINEHEVHKVFSLPLKRFLNDDFTTQEFEISGNQVQSYFFSDEVDGNTIVTWGFTASYCIYSAIILYQDYKKRHYGYTDKYVTLDCLWPEISFTNYFLTNYNSAKL